jgi:hypothetical protein
MKETEETRSIITFTEGIRKVFGKVWREEFADGLAADILLVSAKISSGI